MSETITEIKSLDDILSLCPMNEPKAQHNVLLCSSCSPLLKHLPFETISLVEATYLCYYIKRDGTDGLSFFPYFRIQDDIEWLVARGILRVVQHQICKDCHNTHLFFDEITPICDTCGSTNVIVGSIEFYFTLPYLEWFYRNVTEEQLKLIKSLSITDIEKYLEELKAMDGNRLF